MWWSGQSVIKMALMRGRGNLLVSTPSCKHEHSIYRHFSVSLLWILANCTIWACQSLWKRLSLYLLFPVQHLCQRWGSHMLVDVRAAFVDRKAPDQAMKPFHLCRGSANIDISARQPALRRRHFLTTVAPIFIKVLGICQKSTRFMTANFIQFWCSGLKQCFLSWY